MYSLSSFDSISSFFSSPSLDHLYTPFSGSLFSLYSLPLHPFMHFFSFTSLLRCATLIRNKGPHLWKLTHRSVKTAMHHFSLRPPCDMMDASYLLYDASYCKELQIRQYFWRICRHKNDFLLEYVTNVSQLQQCVLSHGASPMWKGLRQSYACCEAGVRYWRICVLEVAQWNLIDCTASLLRGLLAWERPSCIHYTWCRYNVAQGFTKWRIYLDASLCKYDATWHIFYTAGASQKVRHRLRKSEARAHK